jgi:hypothetical protein
MAGMNIDTKTDTNGGLRQRFETSGRYQSHQEGFSSRFQSFVF